MMRALILCLFAVFALPLSAALFVPKDFTGDPEIELYQTVLLYRQSAGEQELLLRIYPRFEGQGPARLAWVVPLPSKPLRYSTVASDAIGAGPDLHDHLYATSRQQWASRTQYTWPEDWNWPRKRVRDPEPETPRMTADGTPVDSVNISPIRSSGADAVTELTAWLQQRGYRAPQGWAETASWYADNDYSFLCIELIGDGALAPVNAMPAVSVGFATEGAYLPAYSLSLHPDFKLDATIITDGPLLAREFRFHMEALRARLHGYVSLINLWSVQPLPDTLASAFTKALQEGIGSDDTRLFINRVEGRVTRAVEEPKVNLKGEPLVPLGTLRDELPGFWYYGDQHISFPERMFREHFLAAVGVFFATFVVLITLKGRQNRRRRLTK